VQQKVKNKDFFGFCCTSVIFFLAPLFRAN